MGNPGYVLNVYQESPSVYFEDLGHATLSTTAWAVVVCVSIQMTTRETTDFQRYVHYIDMTCSRLVIKNWTACSHFGDTMAPRLQQITNTQKLSDIVQRGEDDRRYKRGLLNFVGTSKISKTLFGTMDDDDTQYYHDPIERFEQGSAILAQLVKQQLIVKSTFFFSWRYNPTGGCILQPSSGL